MEAGSIVVKIKGDSTDLQTALNKINTEIDNTKKKTTDVTGSFIKAELVLQGLQKAFQIATTVIKDSIKAWGEQELAERKLSSQIGSDIAIYTNFANQMQKITNVGDDTIISMQSLAKSMGISNDKINETVKNAISLSKAFGIELNTSVKLVTLAHQGNYEALSRYIPAIRSAKDDTERFNIIQKAYANGWKIATTEIETFPGKLKKLAIAQDEVKEGIGKIVAAISKDFIDGMSDATFALAEFVSSAKTLNVIANIGGVFSGIGAAIKTIGQEIHDTLITKVIKGFKELFSEFKMNLPISDMLNGAIMALAFAFKAMAIPLNTIIDFFKLYIRFNINLVQVMKESALVLVAFFKALSDPMNKKGWDDLKLQAGNAWTEIKDLAKDAVTDSQALLSNMVNGVKNLPAEAEAFAKKIRSSFDKGLSTGKNNILMSSAMGTNPTESAPTTESGGGGGSANPSQAAPMASPTAGMEVGKIVMPAIDTSLFTASISGISNLVGQMNNNIGNSIDNIINSFGSMGDTIIAVAQGIGQAISDAMSIANASVSDFYATQLEESAAYHEQELAAIDENLAYQIELIENNGMTKTQLREQNLSELQAQLAIETDAVKRKDLMEKISAIQKEMEIEKAKKDADEKKAKSDKDYAKKKYKLDVEQFKIKQGMDIAQVWITAAIGVIGAWAQSISQLGPIAGSIVAGVLTGVILALAGVQTGIIASKTPPPAPFATGGIVGGASFAGDNINARLNSGEMILNADQQMQLWDMIANGGSRGQTINLVVDGDILKTWSVNNRRREMYLTY